MWVGGGLRGRGTTDSESAEPNWYDGINITGMEKK